MGTLVNPEAKPHEDVRRLSYLMTPAHSEQPNTYNFEETRAVSMPGMSTNVRLGTLGECTVSCMGSGATALPLLFRYLVVSASISSRMASTHKQKQP
jgi:hypothetical protein